MVKRKSRRKKGFPYWLSIIILLGIGISSWSFYNIFNQGVTDLLLMMGIQNFYLQNSIIIIFVFIILMVLGFGFKKAIERIIK